MNQQSATEAYGITDQQKFFFDVFGFIKLPGFFRDEFKWIENEFDTLMRDNFKGHPKDRNKFLPQALDNSETLCSILELEKVHQLFGKLLGENFLYKGSDANEFLGSSPWHRDYLIRTRACKMLIYLDETQEHTGALRVIPGTHFVDDAFSQMLGAALTWPEAPHLGGFDEKSMLPPFNNPTVFGENKFLPQTVISTKPGDAIVFNHNIIHCTNAAQKPRKRRLLGLHFISAPDKSVDFLDSEVAKLTLVEMRSAKVKRAYGDKLFDHPSERIRSITEPLKSLSLEITGPKFEGYRDANSNDAIDFCNRLKSDSYIKKQREN